MSAMQLARHAVSMLIDVRNDLRAIREELDAGREEAARSVAGAPPDLPPEDGR